MSYYNSLMPLIKFLFLSLHVTFVQIQAQSHIRYAEPDTRDWRGRSPLPAPAPEERSWETLRESREYGAPMSKQQESGYQFARQEQLNSQFSKVHVSSASGVLIFDSL
jgi:translation initiation factor 4G